MSLLTDCIFDSVVHCVDRCAWSLPFIFIGLVSPIIQTFSPRNCVQIDVRVEQSSIEHFELRGSKKSCILHVRTADEFWDFGTDLFHYFVVILFQRFRIGNPLGEANEGSDGEEFLASLCFSFGVHPLDFGEHVVKG